MTMKVDTYVVPYPTHFVSRSSLMDVSTKHYTFYSVHQKKFGMTARAHEGRDTKREPNAQRNVQRRLLAHGTTRVGENTQTIFRKMFAAFGISMTNPLTNARAASRGIEQHSSAPARSSLQSKEEVRIALGEDVVETIDRRDARGQLAVPLVALPLHLAELRVHRVGVLHGLR